MSDPDPKMMFTAPVGPWHSWFAWKPVTTYDQRRVWLRWVRRRCMQKHQHLEGGPDFSWQYHLGSSEISIGVAVDDIRDIALCYVEDAEYKPKEIVDIVARAIYDERIRLKAPLPTTQKEDK